MRNSSRSILSSIFLCIVSAAAAFAADPAAGTLTCVGLYSETSDGYVSVKSGKADWTPVKVGDVVPAAAEVRITVDRDWVEFIATGKPNAVFELIGSESGAVTKTGADILKSKSRAVSFPKGAAGKPDAKYKDKLVVTQYLGRQVYFDAAGNSRDIKYGDVLEIKGKVRIIAINNTLTLMNASSAVTTVIGPLNFTVEQVLKNENLYKFLNVQK